MSILHALILGIVQGITEFLPISSSGHLLLFEYLLGVKEGNLFFNILLHLASLLAVVIIMRKEIIKLLKNPFCEKTLSLVLSTVITVFVVLLMSKNMNKFTTISYLGFGFLLSSIMIFISQMVYNKRKIIKTKISYLDSIIIGFVQGFATLPGISRSGSTICTSLILGYDRKESADFSFLLSIPIIIGAIVFELVKGDFYEIQNVSAIACIVGFLSSFIVAYFCIKFMYKIIKNKSWIIFGFYLLILAVFVLLNQYVFMII